MVFPSENNLHFCDFNKNTFFSNFLSYEPWQKICSRNEQLAFVNNKEILKGRITFADIDQISFSNDCSLKPV
jgi:hypothetical protein